MILSNVIILGIFYIYQNEASSLVTPPQSAVILAFEDAYDLSLLANTISDLAIDTTFIISGDETDYYENMVGVSVIKLNVSFQGNENKDVIALRLCENLISNAIVSDYIKNTQPTFAIFPAVRHDACLLAWSKSVSAIPVLWARGQDEELYVFHRTQMAIPVHRNGFIQNFVENLNLKYFLYTNENNYVAPTQRMLREKKFHFDLPLEELYLNVQLVLWGADPILRVNFALLTQLVAEIGCHHCRGPRPLEEDLQKKIIEFKSGLVVVLLDPDNDSLISEIAFKLPQDRQGLAVVWKNKTVNTIFNTPKNLFVHNVVDRQDLIGHSRARVILSHCTDSEFLESSFHGTPMICFPRTRDEKINAQRAVELGFAIIVGREGTSDSVAYNIKEIHESTKYRENARLVSQAIRDRSNHAMDRIHYWLGYAARHMGEGKNFLLPKKVATYAETLQLIVGFFAGMMFTVIATAVYMSTQMVQPQQRRRDNFKRHKK